MDYNYNTEKLQNEKTTNKTRITLFTKGEIGGGEGGKGRRKKLHRKTFCAKYIFLDCQSNIIVCIIIVRIIDIYTNG